MSASRETKRLNILRQLDLLDTPPSEAFDRITRMAAQLFNLPIAAVSLTDQDRQWFKSRVGLEYAAIPRETAPCAQVAETGLALTIPDLLADSRYRDSRLAHDGIRFYAGASLTNRDGFSLGAMCVLGTEPRQVTEVEMKALADLAAMVMTQIELQHAFGRIDPLSGLPNRSQFVEDLDDLAQDSLPDTRRVVVLIDLASAEQLSGTSRALGAAHVDAMVKAAAVAVGGAMGRRLRAYHVAATQFAFLVPADLEPAGTVAAVTEVLGAGAMSHHTSTVAMGIVPFVVGETAPRDVLRMAHGAAEAARRTRSKVSTYSSAEDTSYRRRFILLNDFAAALESPDQLALVYQPRVDLASGACAGTEALLRWTHPTLGSIPPGEFIPLIERTSLARNTTAWVMEAALRQLACWRDAGLELQLSINVSAANLMEEDFASVVLRGLAARNLAPVQLELEVTESAVMENAEQALSILEIIAQAGVGLAIDDFGTGYSSLSYLQRLPAHVIKIDQSFIHDLACDGRRQALVATMASLSHDLGFRVVAEGVETRAAMASARRAGCDEGQGYLFARPMEERRFSAWLAGWARPGTLRSPAGVAQPGFCSTTSTCGSRTGLSRKSISLNRWPHLLTT